MPAKPRLFTIPPSAPVLTTLARAILDGQVIPGWPDLSDPLSLASGHILLPTRRACRAMREAFLEVSGTSALLLPRIVPMGDVDEEEWTFGDPDPREALGLEGLPPAIQKSERLMLLASLVQEWAKGVDRATMRLEENEPFLVGTGLTDALGLAAELMKLIDQMETEQVPFTALGALDDAVLDPYWQMSARFLTLIGEVWPKLLTALELAEPARRRDLLLAVETERLKHLPGPIIAAGSTGSIRATRDLLKAIAEHEKGAVVLPGLDTRLDAPSFALIGEGGDAAIAHPQHGLKRLIRHIGCERDEVVILGESAHAAREDFLSEAMRPALATEMWQQASAELPDDALDGLTLIEAASEQEEALALALVLRQKAEDGTEAALITSDRLLARRVMAELSRWNVPYDDSGGAPLLESAGAVLAVTLSRLALQPFAPGDLIGLLHGEALFDLAPEHFEEARAAIDLVALRGLTPPGGLDGVIERLGETPERLPEGHPTARVSEEARQAGATLVEVLRDALNPLATLSGGEHSLADFAGALRDVLSALPLAADLSGLAETRTILDDLASATGTRLGLPASEFPLVLSSFQRVEILRPPGARGALIRILGLPEARLADAPCLVLGGLNEGSWPGTIAADPFLSRAMRARIGLEPPERRISLAAHDFCQTAVAREIIYSRAQKAGGVPTVASRWLQRMAAVAGPDRWAKLAERGSDILSWARQLDAPSGPVVPARRPAPKPPREARPTRLSATRIETLIRDPFAIYAERVLALQPLRQVEEPPGFRERGDLFHEAIADAAEQGAFERKPDEALVLLLEAGRKRFAPLAHEPDVMSFWWPRFERVALWLAVEEEKARANIVSSLYEESAAHSWQAISGRKLTLSAKADRLIQRPDGSVAVIDYKTGSVPSNAQVVKYAKQLLIEGGLVRLGAFAGLAKGATIGEATYIGLTGREPPASLSSVKAEKGRTLDDLCDDTMDGVRVLMEAYENEETPYLSRRLMEMSRSGGRYDHLARVAEWSDGDEEAGS